MTAINNFVLFIRKDNSTLKKLAISNDGTYTIGRSESCDIAIDEPALSRVHLSVTLQDGNLSVQDRSSNGSAIGNQRLGKEQAHAITKNTTIDLSEGAITLQLSINETTSTRIPTKVPTQHSELSSEMDAIFPKLKAKGKLTFGRSENCDIVLASLQVSRQHAVLELQGSEIVLNDLQTTNGTFVNGERITGPTTITPDDQINIGSSLFALEGGTVDLQYAIVADNIEKTYPKGFVGLNTMSIKIPSREFVALMGPSGCGKSTLLKSLNGASPITGGSITIQGLQLNNSNFNTLKKHIGYVPQDDIVHRELSVEKTLFYAAKLRMAKDVSNDEINEKINQVLKSLNLDASTIRHNRISELSGGQRKRISIAVELLNDPTILFLDEPTSPLDPETIEDFLNCIRNLVKKGQTVIMVTHKPSDLDYVDKVIFLSKGGYQTYYGNKNEVFEYFNKDSIIEVYSLMKTPDSGKQWNAKWVEQNPASNEKDQSEALAPKPATSMLRQYYWLSARYFNIKWNDAWNLVLLLAQPFIIGLLLVFIFRDMQLSVLFLMAVSAVWFGVSNASKEIVSELAIYERERMFNLSIFNYIASKISILSIIALVQVLIFVSIIYFTYEFRAGEVRLWQYAPHAAFMFFLSVSATIFGLFLSSIFSNTEKVMTFVPIVLMPQIMLAGVMAKMDNDLKIFLSYFTLGRWGTEGFAHIQDHSATTLGHWADKDQSIPASVLQFLPKPPQAPTGGNPPAPPNQDTSAAIEMELQPQGAIEQLDFYDASKDLISLFPQDFAGVVSAIILLNGLFLLGIYIALKRRDNRFM
jgi:ABC transport system ATP-binding/permease protein